MQGENNSIRVRIVYVILNISLNLRISKIFCLSPAEEYGFDHSTTEYK